MDCSKKRALEEEAAEELPDTAPKRARGISDDPEDDEGSNASIRLAIVGWRGMDDYALLERIVDAWVLALGSPSIEEVISGGCRGADTLAERYALDRGIPLVVLHPNHYRTPGARGNQHYAARDRAIAERCTHLVAFPSLEHGKGTQLTIKIARELERNLRVRPL